MKFLFMICELLLLPLFFYGQDTLSCPKRDSITYNRLTINGELSASYIDQRNWDLENHSMVSFLGAIDLRQRLTRKSGWEHCHSFHTEISYMRYADSIWLKSSDYARLRLQWNDKSNKKFQYSYAVFFSTQWLNNYTNTQTETGIHRDWSGGIFNPATLELAYGFNKNLWKSSSINIAFVTAKFNTRPRNSEFPDSTREQDQSLFITKHSYVKSAYGFSAQLNVYEELYQKIILVENDSRLFFNALNRTAINFDFNNRIAIRFLKYLQLRFDLHLIYNPDYSKNLQYRQEVLLGVFYENHYPHAK